MGRAEALTRYVRPALQSRLLQPPRSSSSRSSAHRPAASRLPHSFLLLAPLGSYSRTKRGRAMEARLHTAVSSSLENSMISVDKGGLGGGGG